MSATTERRPGDVRTMERSPLAVRAWVGPDQRADATPVVFVHGFVVSSLYMIPTARRVAATLPSFAPDLPGFGASRSAGPTLDVPGLARALAGFIEALELDRPALVGNSFGCQVVAELAATRPELAGRVVLASPTMDPSARSRPRAMGRVMLEQFSHSMKMRAIVGVDYVRAGLRRTRELTEFLLADRIEDKLDRIEAPTLVVRGGRDPIVTREWASEVAQRLSNGALVELDSATHAMNHEQPDLFARTIMPFLTERATEREVA
jgi:2-hydroxy-6-oxonona-2,4-dienedioate hydrolase